MSEKDILNPTKGWDQRLGDSMNPSYGFTRKRPTTHLHQKAVGGSVWSRETQNSGHAITLSWLGRTLAVALRLKWYYEQYEDGFFTLVDWDGSWGLKGRHYVGRFTTEVSPVETANNRWDIQGVTFEEMPTAPMVKYPNDWVHDAVRFSAFNDFGDQKLATYTSALSGWAQNARVIAGRNVTTMDNPGLHANNGDWACYEYRGYGFRLYLMNEPGYGQCTVSLDGVPVGGAINCAAAADLGPQMVVVRENVPLDFHRVQITVVGADPAVVLPEPIAWHSLEVMR